MKFALPPSLVQALILLAIAAATCLGQDTAEKQRQTAIALEQEGKYTESEVAWRALLQIQPASPDAYANLGLLEARQQRYREAVPLYRKALGLNPAMSGLQMNLGLALFKSGQLKEAVRTFRPLLKSQPPSSPEAQRLRILLGMSYYGLEEYAAAVPYLKEAMADDPQNLPFRLVLAHSCLWSKQYQCVLDVYHQILLLNAESAEADMLAGEALDEMQDHAGATQQFRAAVKANPKEPNVHFGLGYLLWTESKYEEAAQEFKAELANVPNNTQALVYLADANIKMSHPEIALPLLTKAVEADPALEMAHLDLGIVYADAGRQSDALRELNIAAKLSPDSVNVHYRLARLYQVMGKTDEAKAEVAKTKTLTQAANDSVFSKLNKTPANHEPIEGTAAAADSK